MDRPLANRTSGASTPFSFAGYWRTVRRRIDADFAAQLPLCFELLPAEHHSALRRLLDGKRLRASLLYLTCEALGGDSARAVGPALAIEAVHCGSLIHDDFIDRDVLRRQRPAQWTVMGPRRAILFADIVFATALRRMAEYSAEAGRVLGEAIAVTATGAFEEYLEHPASVDGARDAEVHYERVIRMKTAHLFGAAARLGALAAETPADTARSAFRYGAALGEAYQLADDLCDIEAARHGEGRLWAACLPALLRFANESARSQGIATDPERLRRWSETVAPEVVARMKSEIRRRADAALQHLDAFPDGRPKTLLQDAPGAITNLMIEEM